MSGAGFVVCSGCGRLMLGRDGYPQPHECPARKTRHLSRPLGSKWHPNYIRGIRGPENGDFAWADGDEIVAGTSECGVEMVPKGDGWYGFACSHGDDE